MIIKDFDTQDRSHLLQRLGGAALVLPELRPALRPTERDLCARERLVHNLNFVLAFKSVRAHVTLEPVERLSVSTASS